jgi:hypothetical protein
MGSEEPTQYQLRLKETTGKSVLPMDAAGLCWHEFCSAEPGALMPQAAVGYYAVAASRFVTMPLALR